MTKIPNPIEVAVEVENVYYNFNEASIQEASFASLDKLVQLLKDNPSLNIQLNAHTDSKGEEDYNLKLSEERANSVVNYLVKKGIDKKRLTSKGFGESTPIADNENADGTDNPEGRQKNRRTEFQVIKM
jgi:outer membrane protein OmpA-like peptidoglycan-associated protein